MKTTKNDKKDPQPKNKDLQNRKRRPLKQKTKTLEHESEFANTPERECISKYDVGTV